MRALPFLLALLVAAATLALAPPAAAAAVVHAPQSSLDGNVLFVFSQVDIGSVATVHIAGKDYLRTVTESSFSVLVPNVPDGFQRWWANVTLGNSTWRDTGYIAVDTSINRVAKQIDGLQREVSILQNRSAGLAGSDKRLAENLSKVQQGVNLLRQGAGNQSAAPQSEAAQPGPVSLDLASRNVLIVLAVVAACVLLLGLNVAFVLQMRKRSRDSMVFLLALAGHEGVTPDSPEFKKALEAIGGLPKEKKAKKPKAAKS